MSKLKKGPKGFLNWKRGKKEKKVDIEYLTSQTHFSFKELELIYSQFHKEVPGGLLTTIHFKQLIASATGINDDFLSELMFSAFDQEGTGSIDFRQWVLGFSTMTRGDLDEKLRLTFNIYDVEKKNRLNVGQFCRIVQSFNIGGIDANDLVKILDPHHMGHVSFEQFEFAVRQKPAILLGFQSLFSKHDMRILLSRSVETSLSTSESESMSMFSQWSSRMVRSRSRDLIVSTPNVYRRTSASSMDLARPSHLPNINQHSRSKEIRDDDPSSVSLQTISFHKSHSTNSINRSNKDGHHNNSNHNNSNNSNYNNHYHNRENSNSRNPNHSPNDSLNAAWSSGGGLEESRGRKISKRRIVEKRREKKEEKRLRRELQTSGGPYDPELEQIAGRELRDLSESADSPKRSETPDQTRRGKGAKARQSLKNTGAFVARNSVKVAGGVNRKFRPNKGKANEEEADEEMNSTQDGISLRDSMKSRPQKKRLAKLRRSGRHSPFVLDDTADDESISEHHSSSDSALDSEEEESHFKLSDESSRRESQSRSTLNRSDDSSRSRTHSQGTQSQGHKKGHATLRRSTESRTNTIRPSRQQQEQQQQQQQQQYQHQQQQHKYQNQYDQEDEDDDGVGELVFGEEQSDDYEEVSQSYTSSSFTTSESSQSTGAVNHRVVAPVPVHVTIHKKKISRDRSDNINSNNNNSNNNNNNNNKDSRERDELTKESSPSSKQSIIKLPRKSSPKTMRTNSSKDSKEHQQHNSKDSTRHSQTSPHHSPRSTHNQTPQRSHSHNSIKDLAREKINKPKSSSPKPKQEFG